jgi:outer membrane protein assembly factor BamA
MKRKIYLILPFLGFIFLNTAAQLADSTQNAKKEKIKKGWSVGGVPAIAYDSDIGLKLGAVVNFYDYGDGTIYPKYRHSLFFEFSRTTKGSGITQFTYDSKYLIPGVRLSAEASYLTERALDFYGFNGYEALYNVDFTDDSRNNTEYRSRQYFKEERKLIRLRSDFQGRFLTDKARWLTGISFYNIKTDTIDINRLNKGKSGDEMLPAIGGGLYGDYVRWGFIPEDQKYGGSTTLLKGGFIYDTRDNEPNPMHGIWSEILFFWAPGFLCSNNYGYAKITFMHRQYFTLVPDRLSFVYRLAYQGKLWGTMPYYMLPFIYQGGNTVDRDGLGGAKTMRGILRNRVVGEDYAFGNMELRWKFIRTIILKQNVYFALSAFTDAGMVTGKYQIDESKINDENREMFPDKDEKPHISYGGGFYIALNQNFVIAANYGIAADKRDGAKGLYINLNWLF